jgi:hypothetical protein
LSVRDAGGGKRWIAEAGRAPFAASSKPISWIGAVLKDGALSDAPRDDATLIVASLQGALMLAASLDDLSVYDRAAKRIARFAFA